MSERPPSGEVALVAGATRGAGRAIAVELARAGFYVYATGRSSRATGPSEIGRPETIEETGDLIAAAGGAGSALVVDHEDPASVAELVAANRARPGPARRARQRHLRRRQVHGMGQAALGARLGGRAADAADGRAHAPDHLSCRHPAHVAHRRSSRHARPRRRDDGRHLAGERRVSGGMSASTTTSSRPTSSGSSRA